MDSHFLLHLSQKNHEVNINWVPSHQSTHISMEMDFYTGVFDNLSNKDLEASRSQKPGEKWNVDIEGFCKNIKHIAEIPIE